MAGAERRKRSREQRCSSPRTNRATSTGRRWWSTAAFRAATRWRDAFSSRLSKRRPSQSRAGRGDKTRVGKRTDQGTNFVVREPGKLRLELLLGEHGLIEDPLGRLGKDAQRRLP